VPLTLTSKSTELYHRDTVSPGRNTLLQATMSAVYRYRPV